MGPGPREVTRARPPSPPQPELTPLSVVLHRRGAYSEYPRYSCPFNDVVRPLRICHLWRILGRERGGVNVTGVELLPPGFIRKVERTRSIDQSVSVWL